MQKELLSLPDYVQNRGNKTYLRVIGVYAHKGIEPEIFRRTSKSKGTAQSSDYYVFDLVSVLEGTDVHPTYGQILVYCSNDLEIENRDIGFNKKAYLLEGTFRLISGTDEVVLFSTVKEQGVYVIAPNKSITPVKKAIKQKQIRKESLTIAYELHQAGWDFAKVLRPPEGYRRSKVIEIMVGNSFEGPLDYASPSLHRPSAVEPTKSTKIKSRTTLAEEPRCYKDLTEIMRVQYSALKKYLDSIGDQESKVDLDSSIKNLTDVIGDRFYGSNYLKSRKIKLIDFFTTVLFEVVESSTNNKTILN